MDICSYCETSMTKGGMTLSSDTIPTGKEWRFLITSKSVGEKNVSER
jgi:hypothetical protein